MEVNIQNRKDLLVILSLPVPSVLVTTYIHTAITITIHAYDSREELGDSILPDVPLLGDTCG